MTPFSNNIYIIQSSNIYGPYFDDIFLGRKFIMIYVDYKMYAYKIMFTNCLPDIHGPFFK